MPLRRRDGARSRQRSLKRSASSRWALVGVRVGATPGGSGQVAAEADPPKDVERRTGWAQPMRALCRCGEDREEPRNLMRDGRRCREAARTTAWIFQTLEGRIDLVIDAIVRLC
jgi:hypothetical protein